MQDFIKFVVDNWQFVSIVIIIFLFFILLLVFRPTKIVDPSVYSDIIDYVKEAEKFYGDGNGTLKYKFVIDKICHTRGINYFIACIAYGFFIENILSTPHKKDK